MNDAGYNDAPWLDDLDDGINDDEDVFDLLLHG